MSDNLTSAQRSWNMKQIRGKDTGIEVLVRKYLFSQGFRYRKNVSSLPGKPDIVLPKYRTVIFVNGCFWHRHQGCKYCYMPKTRVDFWQQKFQRNIQNDKDHQEALNKQGWNVITVWECQLKKDKCEQTLQELVYRIRHIGNTHME